MNVIIILAVILSVTGAPNPVTRKTPNSGATNSQKKDSTADNSKNPTLPTVSSIPKVESGGTQQNHPDEHTYGYKEPSINITNPAPVAVPWGWHEFTLWVANVLLSLVGLVGVFVAISGVHAANKAANAALLSAESLMKAERAWLVMTTNIKDCLFMEQQMAYYHWDIRNAGKTTARLIDMQCVCEVLPYGDLRKLPAVPHYGKSTPLNGIQLVPHDTFTHYTPVMQSGKPMLMTRENQIDLGAVVLSMRAYGFVRYEDTFGKVCEARFCEFHHRPTNESLAIGWRPLLGVPAAYTTQT